MNLISTDHGGWRLHEDSGAIHQRQQDERDQVAAQNARDLEAIRRAVRNDPPDTTFDF